MYRVLVVPFFTIVEERSRYRLTKGFYRGCHGEHVKGILFLPLDCFWEGGMQTRKPQCQTQRLVRHFIVAHTRLLLS